MKVLHLPTSVAGNSYGLSRGERSLGLESDVLVTYDTKFHYHADRIMFNKLPDNVGEFILHTARITKELIRVLHNYDVYHFNYGSTMIDSPIRRLDLIDLPLFRKCVVTYCGCDARRNAIICRTCSYKSACNSVNKEKRIKKFDKHAGAIFSLNPDIMRVLPERTQFLPYTISNWDSISPKPKRSGKFRIVHAPTDRTLKGSDKIIGVMKRITRDYPYVEFVLIENVKHDVVVRMISEADLLIDQLLSGWYGAVSIEAMKVGVPVVAFINPDDLMFIPMKMAEECTETVIQADPRDSLYHVIEKIILDSDMLKERAKKSLDYVMKWHDPKRVATITKKAYEEI